jgi:hypothetical protein
MKTAMALLALLALALPVRAQELRLAGQRSEIKEARTAVVRTAAEFQALWKQHNPSQAAPAVDFDKEIVVAVFLGERRTGGTKVELELMNDPLDSTKLVVFWKEAAPARKGFTTQVVTSPFEMRAVPKRYAAVTFERNLRARALVDSIKDFAGFDDR